MRVAPLLVPLMMLALAPAGAVRQSAQPPPVVGMSYTDARNQLIEWRPAVVIRVLPNGVPAGADPARLNVEYESGGTVDEDSPTPRVDLYLSTRMPTLVNMTLNEARAAVVPFGITVVGVAPDTDGGWTVLDQTPPAGTIVHIDNPRAGVGGGTRDGPGDGHPDARVSFRLAELVTVPDLTGMSQAGAQRAAEGAGLTFSLQGGDTTGPIVSQEPRPGTRVPRGSTVTARAEIVAPASPNPGSVVGPPDPGSGVTDDSELAAVLANIGTAGLGLLALLLLVAIVIFAIRLMLRRPRRSRPTVTASAPSFPQTPDHPAARPVQVTTNVRFPPASRHLETIGTGADHVVSVRCSDSPGVPILEVLPA